MPNIVLIMVHMYDQMPDVPHFIRWHDSAKQLIEYKNNNISWPTIWHLDHLGMTGYDIHPMVKLEPIDHVSKNNDLTFNLIQDLNPEIVILGGLHKDLCVKGLWLELTEKDNTREYFISDKLSLTYHQTKKQSWLD